MSVPSLRPARAGRLVAQGAAAGLVLGLGALATPAAPAGAAEVGPAPGYPGTAATWSPGDKSGFGTAVDALDSKVWYTLRDGTLSEVYAPRIDTESSRDTQLVVSDGATFADREDTATTHTSRLVDPRALVYEQVNTAVSGKYRITKTYVTDPDRSAVLVDVRFQSLTGQPYTVYVLHDVGLGLNANDDTGRSARGGLVASDTSQAGAVLSSSGFSATSSGYAGRSDGGSDLGDFRMDWSYQARTPGNVVQLGRTRLTGLAGGQRLTLALGFGAGRAGSGRHRRRRAGPGLRRGPRAVRGRLALLPRRAPPGAGQRGVVAHGVRRVRDGARRVRGQDLPRRVRRGSRPALGVGELPAAVPRLPRGVVARPVPDRDRR